MSSGLAGNIFGENIAALQAEVRVMHEHTPGRTPSDMWRDQAFQPDLTPTETTKAVHAAPMIAPGPSSSKMELERAAQNMRMMITCNRPLPLYHGCS